MILECCMFLNWKGWCLLKGPKQQLLVLKDSCFGARGLAAFLGQSGKLCQLCFSQRFCGHTQATIPNKNATCWIQLFRVQLFNERILGRRICYLGSGIPRWSLVWKIFSARMWCWRSSVSPFESSVVPTWAFSDGPQQPSWGVLWFGGQLRHSIR